MRTINDLPEIILEFILTHVDPYKDLQSCSRVNRLWNVVAKRALLKTRRGLDLAIGDDNLRWSSQLPEAATFSFIQKRHSHSCAILNKKMYIFGGCTPSTSTTYNDLWEFDLSRRTWSKPITSGTYPPPKACATMVAYKNKLILFGGWAHNSPHHPLYASWRFFDNIHVFDPSTRVWSEIGRTNGAGFCPASASHSATLFRGDHMLIFGGLQASDDTRGLPYNVSDSVWLLDLRQMFWRKQNIEGKKPKARYGHSQIVVDDEHVFVFGGCSGRDEMVFDMWLLESKMKEGAEFSDEFDWKWHPVNVTNSEDGAPRLSFHPACRVGNKVVILGRSRYPKNSPLKNGVQQSELSSPEFGQRSRSWQSTMCVYSLDISRLVSHHEVSWVKKKKVLSNEPEHFVLYSLVKGEGELLMFGGVKRDLHCPLPTQLPHTELASNCLYSLSFKPKVI